MKTPIELEVMQVSSYVGTESTGNLLVKNILFHKYLIFVLNNTVLIILME